MAYDRFLAVRVRTLFVRRRSIAEKPMFGGLIWLLNGNVCVGIWHDSLLARIGVADYAAALTEPDVRKFDITGREMRGWVLIDPDGLVDDADLVAWVDRSLKFVRTLPPK